ncbi:phenylacetate--CoA ligase family protein [Vibrio splendidus]|uniref:Uncharacterized protein n=1 Tax=Vibrio splendidus TaxID=29497 RepID=A0A2N7JPT3_VIBSP|nr:phenylacetate--CoA ligase family protein [Vibrio splendidus]PMM49345.1 hypothetical protein BCT54_24770 [Vibrio splendidus]
MKINNIRLLIVDFISGMAIYKNLNEIRRLEKYSREDLLDMSKRNYLELKKSINDNPELKIYYNSLQPKKSYSKSDYMDLSYLACVYNNRGVKKSTSGSTGQPFNYYTSIKSQSYLWAGILYSWQIAGYELGENVGILSGSALNDKSSIKKKIFNLIMNFTTYDIGSEIQHFEKNFVSDIKKRNIKFVYGYAAVLFQIAKYLKLNNEYLSVKSVVSTAENLSQEMRDLIEERFLCKVFDQYGCNDAGLSAFECKEHNGFHFLSNRAYVRQVGGMIVSTDCFNSIMPMLDYETGDLGTVSQKSCKCGLPFPIITEVSGRKNDFIKSDSRIFHSAFFTNFFKKIKGIQRYQVLQDSSGKIKVNLESTLINVNVLENAKADLVQELGTDVIFDCSGQNFYTRDNCKTPIISQVRYKL